MFERRLKIFLGIIVGLVVVLLLRAVQLQVVKRDYWRQQAAETVRRSELKETVRGRLLDCRGREIAVDVPCIDACVAYPAIPHQPDPAWLRETAVRRLRSRLGTDYTRAQRAQRGQMVEAEVLQVQADLDTLWATLAKASGQTLEQIDEIRRTIIHRVEMRRRYVWYRRYQQAVEQRGGEPSNQWLRFLLDESANLPDPDDFAVEVAEQVEAHAILRAISPEVNNLLGKEIERFPGLTLRPSTHRYYPYGQTAAHVLGHLSRVTREDLERNSTLPKDDFELRQYLPNDLIGRSGLELLCESQLRGTRGRVDRIVGEGQSASLRAANPGQDVRSTIDIELQREVENLFRFAKWKNPDGEIVTNEMHGAAIVIDVPTGQVRALASVPVFDPNTLDELYSQLSTDEVNRPLMNRATQAQLEPGSTLKPVVGLGGITQGVIRPDETIECTGFLVLQGRKYPVGRCWVATRFFNELSGHVAHHPVPGAAPHPTGFLTFDDAEERSCNIFFETIADRLGIEGLSYWFDKFGLGRATGIGIAESPGRLPSSFRGPAYLRRMTGWFAGIGQGQVAATPLQMANVAATIARSGIWMKPTLLPPEKSNPAGPDRVDLHLSPQGLALCKQGMIRVVNGKAGTGTEMHRDDVLIAGKTGTAQAAKFSIPLRDSAGRLLRDDAGRLRRQYFEPNAFPWYRGTGSSGRDLAHAWFIGFAPANNPQVAFAVMVEYGGSGGHAAAAIARSVLEACAEHGYLSLNGKSQSNAD